MEFHSEQANRHGNMQPNVVLVNKDEQMKSNLRTSIYYKLRLVVYMVQDELRNKITGIILNDLIIQQESWHV